MSSTDILVTLVCALALALVAQCWRVLRRQARRRARRRHYLRQWGSGSPHRAATSQGAAPTPEKARAIRQQAERAARRAGGSDAGTALNPYPRGTPAFVLWVATYHLAATELEEQRAAAAAKTVSDPA